MIYVPLGVYLSLQVFVYLFEFNGVELFFYLSGSYGWWIIVREFGYLGRSHCSILNVFPLVK
jgi:hypothetical protein